jgi:hypothetical protein
VIWPGPLAGTEGEILGLCHGPPAGRAGSDAAQVHPAGAVLDEYQDVQPLQQHIVDAQEPTARIPAAWACRNCRQVRPSGAAPDRRPRRAGSPRRWTRHGDAELQQVALDPAMAPQRILPRQVIGSQIMSVTSGFAGPALSSGRRGRWHRARGVASPSLAMVQSRSTAGRPRRRRASLPHAQRHLWRLPGSHRCVAGRQWALPRYQEPLARIGGTGGQGSSCLPLLSTIRGFCKAAL